MNLSIDLEAIKTGVIEGAEWIYKTSGEWLGHVVSVIKSGTIQALPYLQNTYIAAGSVFVLSSALLFIGDKVGGLATKILPTRTEGQRNFKEAASVLVSAVTWIGGVVAFSRYTQLPLHPAAIAGLTLASAIVVAQFYS